MGTLATNLSCYAHACGLVGNPGHADAVYDAVADVRASLFTTSTVCCFGSIEHALAELAAAAGHPDRAAEHRRWPSATTDEWALRCGRSWVSSSDLAPPVVRRIPA
jgi:hypothetical protein